MSNSEIPQQLAKPSATFKKRVKPKYRKKSNTPPSQSDSDSDNLSENESGHEFKRKKIRLGTTRAAGKTNPTSTGDIQAIKFSADRTTVIKSSNDATRSSDWYDENTVKEFTAKELLGSTRTTFTNQADGTYKGLANTTTFIAKNKNSHKRVLGPIKAPTNLRTITVTDFAPDVCKDYKQTGFCGFGDSCKYLHAREDYKHGWQLDREWENVTKGKNVTGGINIASADRMTQDTESDNDEAALEDIPFACIICKENYRDPIVTKCRHYFCEMCALKRYRKNPSCAACGAATGGVFNVAKNLKKLIERKKAKFPDSYVSED